MSTPRPWIVLKLGGSLITDKRRPETPRPEIIQRLAREIAALKVETGAHLIVGHGSGSFGHAAAARHDVRGPLERDDQRRGAAVTQLHAARLHRLVVEALAEAGALPASIAPSSAVVAEAGVPVVFPRETLERVLALGWTPVLYGDVVPDRRWGAAICSTEILLRHLLLPLEPTEAEPTEAPGFREGNPSVSEQSEFARGAGPEYRRRQRPREEQTGGETEAPGFREGNSSVSGGAVYWLGETAGIYDREGRTLPEIRPDNLTAVRAAIGTTAGTDVTGGMGLRLDTAWALAQGGIASWILDGRQPGILARAVATPGPDPDLPGTYIPAHPK